VSITPATLDAVSACRIRSNRMFSLLLGERRPYHYLEISYRKYPIWG
jgi:hypothetical protein